MEEIIALVIPLCVAFIMPMGIVAMSLYHSNKENERRNKLILAAMEKGQDVNDILQSMQKKQKSIKERQLRRLLWGCLCTLGGIIPLLMEFVVKGTLAGMNSDILTASCIALAVGIAILVVFAVGQRMLKREMEEEERRANEG